MCDCIEQTNEALKEHNTRLVVPFMLDGSPGRVLIETDKIDTKKRTRKIKLHANYCPFCGVGYEKDGER